MSEAWWREAAFYQVYPRSFMDASGDGVGDLAGIIDRLDHLAGTPLSLGVDAIWLSPFFVSPMADGGYDIADHCAVDPVFGSLADVDRLVEEAHRRGLRVIIDLVPNHTSDQHPWFLESRSSLSNPKRSWYVWRRGRDGGPPNNWMAEFRGGSAWSHDPVTDEWYLHSFAPEQPDLNWDEPAVEAAMHEVLRFWLARGIDGFRADVVYKIGKAPDLRDNLGVFVGPGPNDRGRRFDEGWPSVHPRLRAMRRVIRSFGDRMMVGEVYLLDQAQMAEYVRNDDGLDLAHNFHFLNLPWRAAAFRDAIRSSEELLDPCGWPTWCLNNHDHSRVASRYPGEPAARLTAILLLTLRGTPFLYQGEELGLQDGVVPAGQAVDIEGRDPERCPMPWQSPSAVGPGAGFTTGRPWLPIGPDAEEHSVAKERSDPTSVLSLYRRLLAVRRQEQAFRSGEIRWLDADDDDVLVYRRVHGDSSHLVVLNFADRPASIGAAWIDRPVGGIVEVSSSMHGLGRSLAGPSIDLEAYEGLVIRER
ncbi:MAG: alpha-amylase family glycosyl hydrolase [Chloroflexota bacterium]|nr:alpha-amylase family glycosyl hydrolase [Chloroflexota bacterium]